MRDLWHQIVKLQSGINPPGLLFHRDGSSYRIVDEAEIPSDFSSQSPGLQRDVPSGFDGFDSDAIKTDRRNISRDVVRMLKTDPRVDRLWTKLKADANLGGFNVVVESAETEAAEVQAQTVINRLLKQTKIRKKFKGWVGGLLRDGDLFLQKFVNPREREIERVKKLEATITFSRLNAEGDFPTDKKPYYQESSLAPGVAMKEFDEWEITHIKWDGEDGSPYGKPLFASSRLPWKRLDGGEKDIAIRRAMRAGKRLHHVVGKPGEAGNWTHVQDYQERNKDTLQNPMNPAQDYFSDGLVKIHEIGGDEAVGALDDILHHESLIVTASGAPMALSVAGREARVQHNILKEQEEDYHNVIGDILDCMGAGISELIDFALLLAGINPESVDYVFHWGAKDRDELDRRAERAKVLKELGVSFRTIFSILRIDGVTYEEEIERIREQVADGVIPYGVNQRLDPLIAQMFQGAQAEGGTVEAATSGNGHGKISHEDLKTEDWPDLL